MTCLSRLALFLGVKWIGGMQTALLGLAEVVVAVLFSYLWLHEALFSPPVARRPRARRQPAARQI